MKQEKRTTFSLANTPVRRALDRAKRSTLILLLASGLVVGFVYKTWFKTPDAPVQPPAAAGAATQTAPQPSPATPR